MMIYWHVEIGAICIFSQLNSHKFQVCRAVSPGRLEGAGCPDNRSRQGGGHGQIVTDLEDYLEKLAAEVQAEGGSPP